MSRARRKVLLVLLLAVAVLLAVRAARKRHGALERNVIFAGRVVAGEDPYSTPVHSPYPPSYGLVMSPLLLLPLSAARVGWALLQLAMLVVLVALCLRWWRSLPMTRGPPPLWILAAAIALVFRYLWRDTAGGGGNLVWGTLVLLACVRPGEPPGEDRRPWTGLALGLVLAAKPTPVLLLPWLWMRGRHRTLLVALATAAFLHAAPLLTLGGEGWTAAYGRWLEGTWLFGSQPDVFATPALDFPPFTWMNQSLRYALARYLGTVPASEAIDSVLFFPGAGLAPEAIAWIHRLLAALLLATTFGVLWRSRRGGPWVELAAPCGLVCVTLLLSPITWKSYHLLLLPAFFLLLARLILGRGKEMHLRVGLVVYFVVCGLSSEWLLGKASKNVMQSLYVVTLGAIWVWALLLRELRAPLASDSSTGG